MIVLFEYGVDFVSLSLPPPTIENCTKCAFYQPEEEGGCIKTNVSLCQFGRNGYFAKKYMRETAYIPAHETGAPKGDREL
jgi:hypothetical protein